jgi:hypothetical protein
MKLLELVAGPETTDDAKSRVEQKLGASGREVSNISAQ